MEWKEVPNPLALTLTPNPNPNPNPDPNRRLKPLGDVRCRLGVLNPEVDGHVV